jgi:hypothetical protein
MPNGGVGGPRMGWMGLISRRKVRSPPQQSQVKGVGSGRLGADSPDRFVESECGCC